MAVFPIHYFGSVGYYRMLVNATEVVFEVHEHFVKQSHRSRMEILSPNGVQKLVIPTVKTGKRRFTKDVQISYAENWQKDHWKSLEAAYRRSPYFEYYEDQLKALIWSKPTHLSEYNLSLHDHILQLLKISKPYQLTAQFKESEHLNYRLENFNIQDEIFSGWNYENYLQVFSDRIEFVENLSILDMLFNIGPRSRDVLFTD